jgi:hypothetical protein
MILSPIFGPNMAETLGSLCDKLTIVKLKEWHTEDPDRQASLRNQERQLSNEIDEFVRGVVGGAVPLDRLVFAANKVYKPQGNAVGPVAGSIGEVFAKLAWVNCKLWHEQEKVYDFASVPIDQKDAVVKQLAVLNLERNECIDRIDRAFRDEIKELAKCT